MLTTYYQINVFQTVDKDLLGDSVRDFLNVGRSVTVEGFLRETVGLFS